MSVTLSGAGGLFTRLGKIAHAFNTINTVRAENGTVYAEIEDAWDAFSSATGVILETANQLITANNQVPSSLAAAIQTLQTVAENTVIEMVHADKELDTKDLETALIELFSQMIANSDSVDASVPAISSFAAGGSNTGNGTFISSVKRGDGLINELILAELIEFTASSPTGFEYVGEISTASDSGSDFPLGSGSSGTVDVVDSATTGLNILKNASFTNEDNLVDEPDDWEFPVGTRNTTYSNTDYEWQSIGITGTPTGGTYILIYTNADSEVQRTPPLAFNASASNIQAALRNLVGLSEVTVTTTGTSPNVTHFVLFVGPDFGDIAMLSSENNMTGGTPNISHGESTAGDAAVYTTGRALELTGTGSENTELRQNITASVTPNTQYALVIKHRRGASAVTAGVLTVSLDDGAGNTIDDDQGTANSTTIDCTALTTSWTETTVVFRVPNPVPEVLFLRIRASTAISNTHLVYLDHLALWEMTELYEGGPYVAIYQGSTPFIAGDKATLTAANGREGEFQEFFQRFFDLRGKGMLIPSDSSGSETIDDALIA